jgi:parallel beta-helix repeat protein
MKWSRVVVASLMLLMLIPLFDQPVGLVEATTHVVDGTGMPFSGSDNIVEHNEFYGKMYMGIQLTQCDNCHVHNNTIDGSSPAAGGASSRCATE